MAKRDRRRRSGNGDKKNDTAHAGDYVLRERALRAVRNALTRAEQTVRSIDAALRRELKPHRRITSANRRSKARQG
jgi:hypothetical protein